MKKFFIIILIIGVLGAIGYFGYTFFGKAEYYNDKVTLTEDFFGNIGSSDICDTHFNQETVDLCTTFVSELDSTAVASSITADGPNVEVEITIGDNDTTFIVTFVDEAQGGISGFFNNTKYYIDTIQ